MNKQSHFLWLNLAEGLLGVLRHIMRCTQNGFQQMHSGVLSARAMQATINVSLVDTGPAGFAHWAVLVRGKALARQQRVVAAQWYLVRLHASIFSAWRAHTHKLQASSLRNITSALQHGTLPCSTDKRPSIQAGLRGQMTGVISHAMCGQATAPLLH